MPKGPNKLISIAELDPGKARVTTRIGTKVTATVVEVTPAVKNTRSLEAFLTGRFNPPVALTPIVTHDNERSVMELATTEHDAAAAVRLDHAIGAMHDFLNAGEDPESYLRARYPRPSDIPPSDNTGSDAIFSEYGRTGHMPQLPPGYEQEQRSNY